MVEALRNKPGGDIVMGQVVEALRNKPGGYIVMGQVVEALRNKPRGHGFDSRWCHWNFSLT